VPARERVRLPPGDNMTTTEICLIVIAAVLSIKAVVVVTILVRAYRLLNRELPPLARKTNGVLDNLSSVSTRVREQVEELQMVVNDISFKTREVTAEVQQKIIPTIQDVTSVVGGVARLLSFFFGRKKS
jgi:hypothetical protein